MELVRFPLKGLFKFECYNDGETPPLEIRDSSPGDPCPPFPTGTVVVDYSLQLFCSAIKISMVVSALTPSLLCEDSGWRTLHFQTQSVGDLYMCMTSCGVSVILNKEMGGINKVCYLNSALL